MNKRIRNLVVIMAVCSLPVISACSSTPATIADAGAGNAAVFGSFELVRNGEPVEVGSSLFANHVTMALTRQDSGEHIVGRVGDGGEFTWYLEPGDYHVASLSFGNRGERVEPAIGLNFTVAEGADAVYLGAMTVYVASFSGYHGVDARFASEVRNACRRDCDARLTELALTRDQLAVSILHMPGRMARNTY